mmetsp:Transcript_20265/g.63696  ORF Transcript_20265/g.63696 Transcript_20265/m.63696 type:complete len:292 (+) Transcript_20265:95-970(+)
MSFGELGRRGQRTSSSGVGLPSGVTSGGPRVSGRAGDGWGSGGPRAAEPRRPDVQETSGQISEWLRQFQHNLALLERLSESLDAAGSRPSDEALRQVSTQQEVVEELGATVRRGLGEMSAQIERMPRAEQARPRAAHAKLNKDADRVSRDLARVLTKLKQSRRNALAKKPAAAKAVEPGPHRVGHAQFGPSDAPGDLDVMIGEERVQLQVAMQEEAINDAILQEREDEIREINRNVHKVNEIFRDLANLVDKQQHEVDQISELVEKSHQHAEKGLDQVQKAAKLQPSCAIS